jgi:hypothetical protein
MATPAGINGEDPVSIRGHKIVRRLDEFPELIQALRDGDLMTGRCYCAQLFDFDTRRSLCERQQTSVLQTRGPVL